MRKKKINSLKRYIQSKENELDDYYKMDEEYYKDQIEQLELSIKLLKQILNLISKQQKEIEYKDKELLELMNSDKGKMKQELQLKDKEIDLMAELIGKEIKIRVIQGIYTKSEIKYIDTKEKIKQYFINKAKEEM